MTASRAPLAGRVVSCIRYLVLFVCCAWIKKKTSKQDFDGKLVYEILRKGGFAL